ncbi:MAG: hypothetical protein FJ265_07535 [Planctomycetes bacterium]|nr:hypothetical protein [Planctomycetota bacterium]
MRTFLLSFVWLATALAAQPPTVTTPNPVQPQNVDRPFPGGIGHYQQWYAASEFMTGFTTPVRIEQLEFFAGSSNSSNATTIDMEVWMGHGNSLGLTSTFASNFSSPPVVVWPRANVQLLAGAPGAVVMTVPFLNRFTWDRARSIVVEIRIFGNSRANSPFLYNLRGTAAGIGTTARNYVAGNATAPVGTVQQYVGMVTRFTGRPGGVIDFGVGCPGEGNFVPRNTSVNIPFPGTVWNNQLTQAASQRFALFAMGLSNTQTSSQPPIPLPADLGPMLGIGPTACDLLVDPFATFAAMTVGGGAGSGAATLPITMPAMTVFIGLSIYTQWLVADPLSSNGVIAVTQGVWCIVG